MGRMELCAILRDERSEQDGTDGLRDRWIYTTKGNCTGQPRRITEPKM
jgi:hypothetical protein